MRDKVLTPLVEGQAEAPPVEAVEGELATMNATTEVNTQLLQLIQDPQQQVSSLATTNNRTNQGNNNGPPNPPNPRNPSNSPNLRNRCCRNTIKYCWSHGAFSHTSLDFNNKKTGHKDAAIFLNKMEGSEYCLRTVAE